MAWALLCPPAPWGLPGRCRGRLPHELLFHVFVLDPSLLVLPGPGLDVRLHSWAGGPPALPRLPPTSPGAAGRGLPAARPCALGLVDLVHSAVSQLTHQLAGEGGAGISPAQRAPPKLADLAPAPDPRPPPIQRPVTAPHTFSSSGSHESRVRDRTLEQWTPRLLDGEAGGGESGHALVPAPHPATRWSHLWMPEHSMQSSTPRLMLAQRGSGRPQSPHWLFPATCCTRCSTRSPLALRSRESVAESMLLADGDAVRSSLWRQREGPLSPSLPSGAPPPPQTQVLAQAKARGPSPRPRVCTHAHVRVHTMHTRARVRPAGAVRACAGRWRAHLAVAAVGTLPVGGRDAGLHGLNPRLPQLLRVGLQHAAPAGKGRQAARAGAPSAPALGRASSLGGRHDLKAEPALDVLTGLHGAEPEVVHHHGQHVLRAAPPWPSHSVPSPAPHRPPIHCSAQETPTA